MIVCSPVGVAYQNESTPIAVGEWHRTNWLGAVYYLGKTATNPGVLTVHTGDDLIQYGVSCAGAPVYAMLSGIVTYAEIVPHSTWGWLVVIQHGPHLYSRYAHFKEVFVHKGQAVVTGQQIGTIGNAFGQLPYHLHVDVSETDLLLDQPRNWPGLDRAFIMSHYTDVLSWLRSNQMTGTPIPVTNPDTAAAARTFAAAQPPTSKVTVVFDDIPARDPSGIVTAFQVDLKDLATILPAPAAPEPVPVPTPTPTPVPAPVTYYVTATIGLKTHSAANVISTSLGSLAYRQSVSVEAQSVPGTDENGAPAPWRKIVTGRATNGTDVAGQYVIEKYLSLTLPPA